MQRKILGKKEARKLVRRLRDIRQHSTMRSMSVDSIYARQGSPRPAQFENGKPVHEHEVSDFIRERTRIWRDSWVTGPLDEIIMALEVYADEQ